MNGSNGVSTQAAQVDKLLKTIKEALKEVRVQADKLRATVESGELATDEGVSFLQVTLVRVHGSYAACCVDEAGAADILQPELATAVWR